MACEKEEYYSKLISDLKFQIYILKKEGIIIQKEHFKLSVRKKEMEREIIEKQNLLETYEIKYISTLIYKYIQEIPNFNLLSLDDAFMISKAIDKTDYSSLGKYPRFIDLENIVKYIIQVKQKYPSWELTNIHNYGRIDTLPPKNCYSYQFATPEGRMFY
jgi:hypothetical protein